MNTSICSEPIELCNYRQKSNVRMKTLVLDLDETLIHSSFEPLEWYDYAITLFIENEQTTAYVQVRPGFYQLMDYINKNFDVYIYTASIIEYASPIVHTLLPNFDQSHLLARNYCQVEDGILFKNLDIFRRNFSDILIIDNNPDMFRYHKDNGVEILTWTGDREDNVLTKSLYPFLAYCQFMSDVRPLINFINNQ